MAGRDARAGGSASPRGAQPHRQPQDLAPPAGSGPAPDPDVDLERDRRAGLRGSRTRARYRGPDRRGLIAGPHPQPGAGYALVATVVLLVSLAVLAGVTMDTAAARMGLTPGALPGSTMPLLVLHLQAAGFAVALLVGAMCYVRWRLIADATLAWLAVTFGLYAVLDFGLGSVLRLRTELPVRLDVGFEPLTALYLAATVVVIALVAAALRSPDIDSRIRIGWLLAGTATATGALAGLLTVLPITPWLLSAPGLRSRLWAGSFALLWLALTVWAVRSGVRRPHPVLPWFALLFFALGVVALGRAMPPPGGGEQIAAPLLVLTGLLAAGIGTARGITEVFASQRGQLLASVTAERAATARARVADATQAERAHEASNALTAIEAAVRTLQRHQDRLDPHERSELSAAVTSEIARLQQVVSPTADACPLGRFRITEALAPIVTCARSQGVELSVEVPAELVAVGQPATTSQVLLNLFENVRRHAGGRATVAAELDGDTVVVRVCDDGPGIATDDRQRIFERRQRGASVAAPGSGLGLYVSSRLMHDQGGSLDIEERPYGGACFALRLPGFLELPIDRTADESLDDGEQDTERVADRQLTALPLPRDHESLPGGVEFDDGVRDDLARG